MDIVLPSWDDSFAQTWLIQLPCDEIYGLGEDCGNNGCAEGEYAGVAVMCEYGTAAGGAIGTGFCKLFDFPNPKSFFSI